MAVCRLDETGAPVLEFGPRGCAAVAFDQGGGNDDVGFDVAVDGQGRIVVAGVVESSQDGDFDMGVVRINSDGTLDGTFGLLGGTVVPFNLTPGGIDVARKLLLLPDGGFFLVGSAQTSNGWRAAVAKLTPAGELDPAFGFDGRAVVATAPYQQAEYVRTAALQKDGKIVL